MILYSLSFSFHVQDLIHWIACPFCESIQMSCVRIFYVTIWKTGTDLTGLCWHFAGTGGPVPAEPRESRGGARRRASRRSARHRRGLQGGRSARTRRLQTSPGRQRSGTSRRSISNSAPPTSFLLGRTWFRRVWLPFSGFRCVYWIECGIKSFIGFNQFHLSVLKGGCFAMWKKKLTDAWSDYVLRQRMGGTGCFCFCFYFT